MKKFLVGIATICLLTPVAARAQQPLTKDALIQSLRNSASDTGQSSAVLDVEQLRQNLRNGLTVESTGAAVASTASPRQQIATALASRPSVNIMIFFDYDSASIKPESIPDLVTLGNALSSSDLTGSRFLVAGHTDGKGARDYNLGLSQRRSEAVHRFLAAAFPGIADRLIPIGFGMEQLKTPTDPLNATNRRVQIVNIGM